MRVGSLFSGIGGLDLGLERAGMSVAWQCEIDPYCRAVLAHHWPNVPCYEDIREVDGSAETVDLICGGFPCQPFSSATRGRGRGKADSRWLWPEFARVVGLLRPRYVLVENVPGLVRQGLSDVVGDLAAMGYDAEWGCLDASSLGAPHRRTRVWLVAYANSGSKSVGTQHEEARFLSEPPASFPEWETSPSIPVDDGVPERMAQLCALGNAVVPQVAEFVGRLLLEAETREAVGADA